MGIVCIVLGLVLLVAAWNADTPGVRWFLVGCAALNLLGAADMFASGFLYASRLAPYEAPSEPAYRR